jgi:ATP-dependent exoDNAse (exonuclease V) beta subunit (contains helicase and exonuclease domains)
MLVIAGPGTGKTHLLSARVASILTHTDAGPENILCLTFTSSGADNMRERLNKFIGEASYRVTISTYHEFGSLLIRSNPEYFNARELREPTDAIMTHKILKGIKDELNYNDPLWYMEEKTLGNLIRDARLALLTPDDLRQIARVNGEHIELINSKLNDIFDPTRSMSTKLDAVRTRYTELQELLESIPKDALPNSVNSLSDNYLYGLTEAWREADEIRKAKPLNSFKTNIITKDGQRMFILKATKANNRVGSLANIYEKYLQELESHGMYDYDDMILETVRALEQNPEFKADLQERYQYILLDEYQDTNAAQSKIVELLADSPVNESQPNVMAVGDDDQAIYAFQGALSSNLKEFYSRYRGVKKVTLTKNYRSASEIIDFSKNISDKIEDKISATMDDIDKSLTAEGKNKDYECEIERVVFKSTVTENAWVAKKIKGLIDGGTAPGSIAVLSRNNKELADFVPYLDEGIKVSYERSENILKDSRVIRDLLLISKLVIAVSENVSRANELWPEALSLDMWQIDITQIWKVSWAAKDERISWSEAALKSEDEKIRDITQLILSLGLKAKTETMERMIDMIVGAEVVGELTSPMRKYYETKDEGSFYELLSHLSVLRSRLKNYVKKDEEIGLQNLIGFAEDCAEAEVGINNSSPYCKSGDAIDLMTAHKAKGLEWDNVFIISATNQLWVKTGSQGGSHLPINLAYIHPSGDRADDQKRLLFVSLTRARHHLYITNARGDFSGKKLDSIEYFDERPDTDDDIISHTLPAKYRVVKNEDVDSEPTAYDLQASWKDKHIPSSEAMKELLKSRLKKFRLSPTHINSFTDPEYGGPKNFYENSLLLFPHCMSDYNIFGDCVHKTMEALQKETAVGGKVPSEEYIYKVFDNEVDRVAEISGNEKARMKEHARTLFPSVLEQKYDMLLMTNVEVEVSFGNEGIVLDGVPLNGRIDRIEIDHKNKTMAVVDFKTGRIGKSGDKKSYKNRTQVYFYKLLVENSIKFRGYTVTSGRIEYIDPDGLGKIQTDYIADFDVEEMDRLRRVIKAVWDRIQNLDFPDTSEYAIGIDGLLAFEDYLLDSVK